MNLLVIGLLHIYNETYNLPNPWNISVDVEEKMSFINRQSNVRDKFKMH